jgi:DNA invertase Pin-like site-specific DNA recombinase
LPAGTARLAARQRGPGAEGVAGDEVSDKTAIVYIRVSTGKQAAEGVSLDAQRARAETWCFVRRYRLGDVYSDEGVSGKRADNRPGLQAALDAVCACRGVLVCYSLSRVARSVRDAHAVADRLKAAGADLVSLTENLDTTTPTGRLMFGLLAVLAEFERDLVSERTLGAMTHKRALGSASGRSLTASGSPTTGRASKTSRPTSPWRSSCGRCGVRAWGCGRWRRS